MSFGDFSRINTNVQALGSLRTLQDTNNMLGMRQLRLATGSRLNRAEDDLWGIAGSGQRCPTSRPLAHRRIEVSQSGEGSE